LFFSEIQPSYKNLWFSHTKDGLNLRIVQKALKKHGKDMNFCPDKEITLLLFVILF